MCDRLLRVVIEKIQNQVSIYPPYHTQPVCLWFKYLALHEKEYTFVIFKSKIAQNSKINNSFLH